MPKLTSKEKFALAFIGGILMTTAAPLGALIVAAMMIGFIAYDYFLR